MATLQTIAKMAPLARIKALNDYITKGDAALTQARDLRIRAVADLRQDENLETWRRLSDLTGLSEQHLRAAVTSLPNRKSKP